MVARWGEPRSPTGGHREQDAGDHQGLVKLPRIFLALPHSTALAPTDGRALSIKPARESLPRPYSEDDSCERGEAICEKPWIAWRS